MNRKQFYPPANQYANNGSFTGATRSQITAAFRAGAEWGYNATKVALERKREDKIHDIAVYLESPNWVLESHSGLGGKYHLVSPKLTTSNGDPVGLPTDVVHSESVYYRFEKGYSIEAWKRYNSLCAEDILALIEKGKK